MNRDDTSLEAAAIETERLLLRPWRPGDAALHHQLWSERDPRVPAHRRLNQSGHPSIAEMEIWILSDDQVPAPGLLVVQRRGSDTGLGYCGLIENSTGNTEEPELAFEFLQEFWNYGYATESGAAVIDQARTLGYPGLASTVRAWNTASLRVLEKLGFVNTGVHEHDEMHGDSLLLRKSL